MRRRQSVWTARWVVWLVGLAMLWAPLAAAAQSSFLLGLESYALGWTQAGEQVVEEAARDRSDTEARLTLGLIHWAEGRLEQAAAVLEDLVPDVPAGARPHLEALVSRLLLERGLPPEAERMARRALASAPDLALAQLTLGEALLAQERPAEALDPLRAARTSSPDLASAYLREGQAHARLEQWQDARQVLEDGVKVDPWSAEMHLELGRVYERLDETAKAAHAYDRAARLDPALARSVPPASTP